MSVKQDFMTHDFANHNFKKLVFRDFINVCN